MANHEENKNTLRKSIQEQIAFLNAASGLYGISKNIPREELAKILSVTEKLQHELVVYAFLENLPEEKIVPPVIAAEKKQEPVIIPQTEVKHPEPKVNLDTFFQEHTVPKPETVAPKTETVLPKTEVPAPKAEIIPPVIPPAPEVKKPEPVKEIPQQPAKKNLPDIKSLIGFNEKLMFLRSLFNNDNAAYEAALQSVNSFTTAAEANAFLAQTASAHNWNSDSEPVQVFYSIVKRRFV